MSYVITQKHTFELANQVMFAYSLDEAEATKSRLEAESGKEWLIAAVLA